MVWLVGHKGMLGSEVQAELDRRGIGHMDSDMDVDIADASAVQAFLEGRPILPSWIINCAAYTAVDKAEDDEAKALRVNCTGVDVLAKAASRIGAALVHLSTDYVFAGTKSGAYGEDDAPGPLSAYGRTKLAGEEALRPACPRHYIVRPSWLFGKAGPNFVATMLRLFRERNEVRVVSDQWGRPTYAVDLARALVQLVTSGREAWGTYHYSNKGRTSWHGFAQAIMEAARAKGLVDRAVRVVPITTPEYPTKAHRPANSEMSTDKIERTFGLDIPSWRHALDRYLTDLAQGAPK